jgi:twitching motility protein PilT
MITKTIGRWLEEMWEVGASDLHLTVGAAPHMRVDGQLRPAAGGTILTAADVDRHAAALHGRDPRTADPVGSVDFAMTWGDKARLRGNVFQERGSLAVALRMIPTRVPSVDELGVPASVQDLLHAPSGLLVVTGPTGSGKSSTLASMVDAINRTRAAHILTIEDPIEYVHEHLASIVQQREVGRDAPDFPMALRSALREDPDVLLVGEMRDLDSIQTALTIAETGHLVLATMHTNDATQAVDRIIDVFPAEGRSQIQTQLASTLQAVVYQRLVPRVDGGRIAAFEVMIATNAVRNLVREGKSRQLRNVIATGRVEGMQTLEHSLTALVEAGTIELDAARAVSLHPEEIAAERPLLVGAARDRSPALV